MTPQEALDAIIRALRQSDRFSAADYISESLDPDGANPRLKTPFVVVLPVGAVRNNAHNTDRVGYVTDEQDNRIGQVYEGVFEMTVQLDIYLASGDDTADATVLGGDLRDALYRHDSAGPAEPFPDGEDGKESAIRNFDVGSGQRADDLSGPGIRRWRHESEIRFVSRVDTTAEPITEVATPTAGDRGLPDDDSIEIEYTVQD